MTEYSSLNNSHRYQKSLTQKYNARNYENDVALLTTKPFSIITFLLLFISHLFPPQRSIKQYKDKKKPHHHKPQKVRHLSQRRFHSITLFLFLPLYNPNISLSPRQTHIEGTAFYFIFGSSCVPNPAPQVFRSFPCDVNGRSKARHKKCKLCCRKWRLLPREDNKVKRRSFRVVFKFAGDDTFTSPAGEHCKGQRRGEYDLD